MGGAQGRACSSTFYYITLSPKRKGKSIPFFPAGEKSVIMYATMNREEFYP